MKIGILGGGNCYALNLANLCKQEGIDVFGIGRSPQLTMSTDFEVRP